MAFFAVPIFIHITGFPLCVATIDEGSLDKRPPALRAKMQVRFYTAGIESCRWLAWAADEAVA